MPATSLYLGAQFSFFFFGTDGLQIAIVEKQNALGRILKSHYLFGSLLHDWQSFVYACLGAESLVLLYVVGVSLPGSGCEYDLVQLLVLVKRIFFRM